MSEQEIIIRKSAELKLMVGLALSLEECETFIKDVLEAQQQVNVTLGSVSKPLPDGDDIWCKASEMSRDNFADWYDNL